MERLKGSKKSGVFTSRSDLHSSMERLKGLIRLSSNTIAPSFTFQYGEIKSDELCSPVMLNYEFTFQYGEIKSCFRQFSRRIIISFTFQYGEIKSRAYQDHRRGAERIYIPVWRD